MSCKATVEHPAKVSAFHGRRHAQRTGEEVHDFAFDVFNFFEAWWERLNQRPSAVSQAAKSITSVTQLNKRCWRYPTYAIGCHTYSQTSNCFFAVACHTYPGWSPFFPSSKLPPTNSFGEGAASRIAPLIQNAVRGWNHPSSDKAARSIMNQQMGLEQLSIVQIIQGHAIIQH